MTTQAKTCCCRVDSDNAVNLNDILNSFKAPMKEEHTWALCYQCIRFFIENHSTSNEPSYLVRIMTDVYLRTDGNVHPKTSYPKKDINRPRVGNETEIIMGLGMVLYSTLDHCYKPEEERIISEPLAQLMNDMIENVSETDDEGIERDSEDNGKKCGIGGTQMTLKDVLQRCEAHVSILTKSQAECHYKAVVRALVTEALELSTFLDIVAKGIHLAGASEQCTTRDLDQLQFMDWSSLWLTVISELRMGVKLKKVNYGRAPIEYELTPYEILMKDIRNYKQNLRKVRPENIGRHARDMILEFIRSRPPLRKASDRKLAPKPPKFYSPREQLMHSIRKGQHLRKTSRQHLLLPTNDIHNTTNITDTPNHPDGSAAIASSVPNHLKHNAASDTDAGGDDSSMDGGTSTKRRLIAVDFSQIDCDDDFDDDDELDDDDGDEEMNLWSDETSTESRQNFIAGRTIVDKYDLAMGAGFGRFRFKPSIRPTDNGSLHVADLDAGCRSVPQSRPLSRQSCDSTDATGVDSLASAQTAAAAATPLDQLSLDNRLSLTLEEIVHIRTVLTKAEIEALPIEASVRANVEGRKVCFLCLKTRFSVFGPWGQRCILCQCTVCARCSGRMRIPMEHFASVPVVLLSPNIMSATPDGSDLAENDGFFPNTHSGRSTPDGASIISSSGGGNTLHSSPSRSRPHSSLDRFRARTASNTTTSVMDRLRAETGGQLMVVCHDCRAMVLQIIKSAQANRSAIRNKHLQSLTLDLSPMF